MNFERAEITKLQTYLQKKFGTRADCCSVTAKPMILSKSCWMASFWA